MLLAALAFSSAFSVAMVAFRIYYSHETWITFLLWNLFLAWIPLVCALGLWRWGRKPGPASLAALAIWLLFFPNCPYIVTDLMHLPFFDAAPAWYEVAMLFSFAWNGLVLGLVSLWIVQMVIREWWGEAASWLWVLASLGAGAFGVFLGRALRWNSWDVVTEPWGLAADILPRILKPWHDPGATAMTILYGVMMAAAYFTVAALARGRWERGG